MKPIGAKRAKAYSEPDLTHVPNRPAEKRRGEQVAAEQLAALPPFECDCDFSSECGRSPCFVSTRPELLTDVVFAEDLGVYVDHRPLRNQALVPGLVAVLLRGAR